MRKVVSWQVAFRICFDSIQMNAEGVLCVSLIYFVSNVNVQVNINICKDGVVFYLSSISTILEGTNYYRIE